jgi:hypothetical protein
MSLAKGISQGLTAAQKLLRQMDGGGIKNFGPSSLNWAKDQPVGPKIKNRSTFKQAGDKYRAEHGSLTGHTDKNMYDDPSPKNPTGGVELKSMGAKKPLGSRTHAARDRDKAGRKGREDRFESELYDELEAMGRTSEYEELLAIRNKGMSKKKREISKMNKGVTDTQQQMSRGHIGSLDKGSPDVPENIIPENRSLNSRRQSKQDPGADQQRMSGAPLSTKEWIHQQDLKKLGIDFSKLPDRIKEKILAAKDRDEIDDILTEYYKTLEGRRKRK